MTMPSPEIIAANNGKDYIDLGVVSGGEEEWGPLFDKKFAELQQKAARQSLDRVYEGQYDTAAKEDPRTTEAFKLFGERAEGRFRQATTREPARKVPGEYDPLTLEQARRVYPAYKRGDATPKQKSIIDALTGQDVDYFGQVEQERAVRGADRYESYATGLAQEIEARGDAVRARIRAKKTTPEDVELMKRALMSNKLNKLLDPTEYSSTASEEKPLILEGWVKDTLAKTSDMLPSAAYEAAQMLTRPEVKEEAGLVKPYVLDTELLSAFKDFFPKEGEGKRIDSKAKALVKRVESGFGKGVIDARVKRQKPIRDHLKSRGIKDEDMEKEMLSRTKRVVNSVLPGGITNINKRQFFINNLNALDISDAEKRNTIRRYDELNKKGFIDSEGEGDPTAFVPVAFGRAGVSGLPKVSSPYAYKINKHLSSRNKLIEEAARGWEETVGKRAKDVLEADSFLEGAGFQVLNAGKDFVDFFVGMVDLAAWDTESAKQGLVDAYANVLVDEGKSGPLFTAEVDLIGREANINAFAGLLHGFTESFKRTFTDTKKSFAGSPVGTIANMIAMARAVLAGGVILPKGTNAARLRAKAAQFLAKVDDQLTLIPAAKKVAMKVPGVPQAVGFFSKFFNSPLRIELLRQYAITEGQGVASQIEQITKSTAEKIEDGLTQEQALKQAMQEAPTQAAEAHAKIMLQQKYGNAFDAVESPQQVLEAILDDDLTRLREVVPEAVLEEAGVSAPFDPVNMRNAAKDTGYETIEINSAAVNKQIDRQLQGLGVDSPEVIEFRNAVDDIRNRIAQGETFIHPEIVPEPNLKEGSTGTPRVSELNEGVNNQALLLALVEEASKRDQNLKVSVKPEDKSFFVGHMVGPKQIIDAVPVAWRSRLPLYERRPNARAPELLQAFKNNEEFDYGLYLKRAKNLERSPEAQIAFEELESLFLESVGLTPDQWSKVRIGGISPGAGGMLEELYFRQTSRAPGAPGGLPALRGVAAQMDYVDQFGNVISPDVVEGGIGVRGEATPQMKAAAKAPADVRRQLEEMERYRMAMAETPPVRAPEKTAPGIPSMLQDTVPGINPMLRDTAPGVPAMLQDTVPGVPAMLQDTRPGVPSMLEDTVPDMPAAAAEKAKQVEVFQQKNLDAVKSVLDRARNMDVSELNRVMENTGAVAKEVGDSAIKRVMDEELQIGDSVVNGGAWLPESKLMAMSGTAEDVAANLIKNQGERGRLFVERIGIENANSAVRKYMNLEEGAEIAVPKYVNDAFEVKQMLDGMSSALARTAFGYVQSAGAWVKRALTTRNPLTFANNFGSNVFLRAMVTGELSPAGLQSSLSDLKKYLSDPKSLDKTTSEILETMREGGALGTFSQNDIQVLKKMPSELLEENWGAALTPPGRAALKKFNDSLNKLEKGYNMADPVFKLDHIKNMVPKYMDAADGLEAGRYIDVETGKSLTQRVYRSPDGTFRLGDVDGRVLSESELRKMMTKKAILSANRLYFDYADVPGIINALRASGLDALIINPFFTWGWKALSIPGVKRGLMDEFMSGAEHFTTNSASVSARMARNNLKNELLRAAYMNTALAADRSEAMESPEVLRFLSRFKAKSPVSGIFDFGPRESSYFSTSGMDPTTNQYNLFSAMLGMSDAKVKEVSKIMSDYDMFLGKDQNVEVAIENMPYNTAEEQAVSDKAQEIWRSKIRDNKDGHKLFINDMRKMHPMFDNDVIQSFADAFGVGRPLIAGIYDKKDTGSTIADRLIDAGIFAIVGSKGFAKLGSEASKVFNEGRDPAAMLQAIGIKKFPNRRFQKAIDRMRNQQRKRLYKEYNAETDAVYDTKEKRIEAKAMRELINIVTELDAQKLRDDAATEAEKFGVDIDRDYRTYKGTELPKYIYKEKGDE